MKILLMGNPNVGKSVLFSRLTGVHVISSNYPGTTVGYTQGYLKAHGRKSEVIDVPGCYTLDPSSEAERVASEMLETGDVIINVVNATNLERNLYLTLQLLERNVPVVVALNMWDDTRHRGIDIDPGLLSELLEVPVIPTAAISGQGILELVEALPGARPGGHPPRTRDERWSQVGKIVVRVQQISHKHHRWFERLEDWSVKPLSGYFIAAVVLALSFFVIRFIGESLIAYVFNPFFQNLWLPVLERFSAFLGSGGVLHDILIGRKVNGAIDFVQSFGVLSSGLYVSFAMVLPYIASFYLVLGLLEDSGYLPRLAILMDRTMHRIGLHGFAIIPTLLGLGCNVPAILATRILESKRERFIASTLVAIAIPCASLQAMILGLVGGKGAGYLLIVYGTLLLVWVLLGMILNRFMKGGSPELLIEIPPYRIPPWNLLLQKLRMRIRGFLAEAVPFVLAAVLVVNLLYLTNLFGLLARLVAPVVTGILGLPAEAITALLIGFLRKDVAMGMLGLLQLNGRELVVGSVVLAMSFPCVATFIVLWRELGLKDLLKSTALMILSAVAAGGILNAALSRLGIE
ncbi:MAG TPA: ferrous iron transporter B [Syntrophales bacterium]|nr:ferrous iron transporter B [Syntrophales bacterium]